MTGDVENNFARHSNPQRTRGNADLVELNADSGGLIQNSLLFFLAHERGNAFSIPIHEGGPGYAGGNVHVQPRPLKCLENDENAGTY